MESSSGQQDVCNIQVAVRVRPLNEDEEQRGLVPTVSVDTERRQAKIQYGPSVKKMTKAFTFDKVFGRFSTQEDIFKATVSNVVDEMLQGFSCTVFAYGQTGTGKTYTMEGDLSEPKLYGIIPRAVEAIFARLEGFDYSMRVSFLELYNEELQDLLDAPAPPGPSPAASGKHQAKKLRLCEDAKRGVVVLGLEEINVIAASDCIAVLKRGIEQRQTASTLCNKHSSRSHSVFTIRVVVKETTPEGEDVVRNGQLHLCDLAGSENIGRSGAKGDRQREAGNINQSLLTLGRVITALTDGNNHVPYRDSKLTRLLQESLGGRSKTCIIATVSPSPACVEETLSTLDYAFRAKSIKNRPEINQRTTCKAQLKEYTQEIESLKLILQATQSKNGIFLPPDQYDCMLAKLAAQDDRIKEGEQKIAQQDRDIEEGTAARQGLQTEVDGLTEKLTATEDALMRSRNDNERLTCELHDTLSELAGTKAVVAEQVETERQLRAQAQALAGSLHMARSDVAELMAKIARVTGALNQRSKLAEAYGEDCKQRFDAFCSGLEALSKTGADAADVMTQAVERIVSEERRQYKAVLGALKTDVGVMVEEGRAAADRVAKEICARLSKEVVDVLVSSTKTQSREIAQQAQEFQTAMETSTADVRTAFADASGALQTALGGLSSHLNATEQALRQLAESHKQRGQEACELLSGYAASADKEAQVTDHALRSYMTQQQQHLRQATQEITATIQSQVEKLLQEAQAAGAVFLHDAQSRQEHRSTALSDFRTGLSSKISDISSTVQSSVDAAVQSHVNPAVASAQALTMDMRDRFTPSHGAKVERVMTEVNAMVHALKGTIASGDSRMQTTLDAGAHAIKSIERENAAIGCLLEAKGSSVVAVAESFATNATTRHADASHSFSYLVKSSLTDPSAAAVNQCRSEVNRGREETTAYTATAVRVEPPTQATPQKRTYPEPQQLAHTRSHEDIMVEARAAHMEKGGDDGADAAGAATKRQKVDVEAEAPSKDRGAAAMEVADTVVSENTVTSAGEPQEDSPVKPSAVAASNSKAKGVTARSKGTRTRIPRGPAKALGEVKDADANMQA